VVASCGGDPQDPEPPGNQPPTELSWKTFLPSEPRLQYTGRVDLSVSHPAFSLPGVSIKARFWGDSIELLLQDHGTGGIRGTNFFQVTLDNLPPVKLQVIPSQTVYPLVEAVTPGEALPAGEHIVEIVKLTEGSVGWSEFQGLRIHGELMDPPARLAKRIEFIGDSITCGYGNEASIRAADNPTTGFHSVNENVTRTYGWLTARSLGVEPWVTCYSGRGVYRNIDGSTGNTLPQLYDRSLPGYVSPSWDASRSPPDVVVINLGTNDFAPGTPDAAQFSQAYKDFIARLRRDYPAAKIICAVGPMLNDYYPDGQNQWTTIQAWVSSVVQGFNQQGDLQVYYLAFTPQDEPYGEDWHPTAATHEAMSIRLVEFIRPLQ
jgi:lysophospholipase L1-like esterase